MNLRHKGTDESGLFDMFGACHWQSEVRCMGSHLRQTAPFCMVPHGTTGIDTFLRLV